MTRIHNIDAMPKHHLAYIKKKHAPIVETQYASITLLFNEEYCLMQHSTTVQQQELVSSEWETLQNFTSFVAGILAFNLFHQDHQV